MYVIATNTYAYGLVIHPHNLGAALSPWRFHLAPYVKF